MQNIHFTIIKETGHQVMAPYHGQRINTYYQIDSLGKFTKVKEIRYRPQVYTADYLNDKTMNIWEGQEEKTPSVQ